MEPPTDTFSFCRMAAAALAGGEDLVRLAKRTGVRLSSLRRSAVPGAPNLSHLGTSWVAGEDAGTASAACPFAAEARAVVFDHVTGELVAALPASPYRESVPADDPAWAPPAEASFARMYDAMAAVAVPLGDGGVAWCAARRPSIRRQTLEECLAGFGGVAAVEAAVRDGGGPCTFLLVHHCLARFDQSAVLGEGYATARLVSGTCAAVPPSEPVAAEDVRGELARPGVLGVLAEDRRTGARTALMLAGNREALEADGGTGVDARIPLEQRALRAALEGRALPEGVPGAEAVAAATARLAAGAEELARLANATTTVGPRKGWMRVNVPRDRELPKGVRFHLAQVREVMRASGGDLTVPEADEYLRTVDVRGLDRLLASLAPRRAGPPSPPPPQPRQ